MPLQGDEAHLEALALLMELEHPYIKPWNSEVLDDIFFLNLN